jgi:hypothetical protein
MGRPLITHEFKRDALKLARERGGAIAQVCHELDIAKIPRRLIPVRGRRIQSGLVTEARNFFRATRRVACAVGMDAGTGKLASVDDKIFVADRPAVKPALQDLACVGGIARLSRERGCQCSGRLRRAQISPRCLSAVS